MTVYDPETLELGYAPPFGAAKDPVNMAGFIGANLLRGDVVLRYADRFEEARAGARILDVRGPDEFAAGQLPGAENVPLDQLRGTLQAWGGSQPLRVYCAVGFRSYLAPTQLEVDQELLPCEPVISYAEGRTASAVDPTS